MGRGQHVVEVRKKIGARRQCGHALKRKGTWGFYLQALEIKESSLKFEENKRLGLGHVYHGIEDD